MWNDEKRIGVYICHCGLNIGGTVDVEQVAKDVRLRREMVAASEGVVFAWIIKEMVEQLKELGPAPFKVRTEALA